MDTKAPQSKKVSLLSEALAKVVDLQVDHIRERFAAIRKDADACYADLELLIQRTVDITVPTENEPEKLQLVAALRAALQILAASTVVPVKPASYRDTKALQAEIEGMLVSGGELAFKSANVDRAGYVTVNRDWLDMVMRERAANIAQALCDRIKPEDPVDAVVTALMRAGQVSGH